MRKREGKGVETGRERVETGREEVRRRREARKAFMQGQKETVLETKKKQIFIFLLLRVC